MKEEQQLTRRTKGSSERFTVSIPRNLYRRGEEMRARYNWNRSEFVAHLYELYLDEAERAERLARYTAAYARVPETDEERALTRVSMEVMGTEAP